MEPFISAAKDINVEEIMAAIRKKIQDKKDAGLLKQREIDEIAEMELQPLPDFLEIPNTYEPHLYPSRGQSDIPAYPGCGQYTDIPAPVAEEIIRETGLAKGVLKKIRNLLSPLIRFMTRPLYLELKTAIFDLKTAIVETQNYLFKHMFKQDPIILQSSEYIRLLHNAINNIIVEASKLKTEEELLKTKIKIMEDKIEFLENRERALEKKLSLS
jgi:hypothetical protein